MIDILKRKKILFLNIILVTVIVLILAECGYVSLLKSRHQYELSDELSEAAQLNTNAVNIEFQSYINTLEAMSSCIGSKMNAQDSETILEDFYTELNHDHFTRLGIIFSNGQGVAMDSEIGRVDWEDFSKQEYFLKSMQGGEYISAPYQDLYGKKEVVLFSIPVYVQGKVEGVLFGLEQAGALNESVENVIYGGKGYFQIVSSIGDIIFRSENDGLDNDIENVFQNISEENLEVDNIKKKLLAGESGILNINQKNGKEKCAVFIPLGVNDWFVVMVVPVSALGYTSTQVLISSIILIFVVTIIGLIMVIGFIYNKRKDRKKIETLAFEDPVTGRENLARFLADFQKNDIFFNGNYAMILFNIKDFRFYNKLFGFNSGDSLIRKISEVLYSKLDKDEYFCRKREDRFLILLKYNGKEIIEDRLKDIISSVRKCVCDEHSNYEINSMCGVYPIKPEDKQKERNNIIEYTQMALDGIGHLRNEKIGFYDEAILEKSRKNITIEKNMKKALDDEEFLVFLQPKYSVVGEKEILNGAEALVRWKSNENGLIYPNEFIPVFENNGFITLLDMYMLEHVCQLQRKWLDEGAECITISVNQSRLHLYNPDYIQNVKAIVDKYRIPYHLIELEITESAIFEDQQMVIKTFRMLHDIGFVTSMDDFGSGYSSLNMLKDIELDVIKIDKEFFGETLNTNRGRNVVSCILKMLRELKLTVVAEGIETAEQVEFLKVCGCDMIQGYFFGKPSPIEEFESSHFYLNRV